VEKPPTRLSAAWTAVAAAVVLLIALIVFIGQNTTVECELPRSTR
jgi:uncharacterized integral membrane protein